MPFHRLDRDLAQPRLALALLILGLPLAGCSNVDRAVATSPIPPDYHLRHPVVLANARHSLDIFLVPAQRQARCAPDRATSRPSRPITGATAKAASEVQVPRGAVDPRAADATLGAVRRALAACGCQGRDRGRHLPGRRSRARLAAAPELHQAAGPPRLPLRRMAGRPRIGLDPEHLGQPHLLQPRLRHPANPGRPGRRSARPRAAARRRPERRADAHPRHRRSARQHPAQGQDPGTSWTSRRSRRSGGASQ